MAIPRETEATNEILKDARFHLAVLKANPLTSELVPTAEQTIVLGLASDDDEGPDAQVARVSPGGLTFVW